MPEVFDGLRAVGQSMLELHTRRSYNHNRHRQRALPELRMRPRFASDQCLPSRLALRPVSSGDDMTDLPKDAALTISRWCWSTLQWESTARWTALGRAGSDSSPLRRFDTNIYEDVRAAELVLIERGLAEEYGEALFNDLYPVRRDGLKDLPRAVPAWRPWLAEVATAPIEARARAILAVIEGQRR